MAAGAWLCLQFSDCRCVASMFPSGLMTCMRRQFKFAGVSSFSGRARSPHSEAKFPSVGGGACGCSCVSNTAIQRLPLLGEHVFIRSDDVNANAVQVCRCCRFFSSRQVPNMAVFRSLETAHFGADFYAVFRDDFTDLHQNLHKRSSLVQEWRRRFEFLAFHLHSKKIQPDRCHWKPLILEPI